MENTINNQTVVNGNEVGTFQCVDCGEKFVLTVAHQAWFLDHGLDRPLRCTACMEIKRAKNAEKNNELNGQIEIGA